MVIGANQAQLDAIWFSRELEPGDRLVLLLHGLGADEHDIAALAPALPSEFVYAAPRGLFPFENGWAWLDRQIDPHRPEIHISAAAVETWLEGLDGIVPVGAIGFSQGGILALQLLRRDPSRFAWVAQLSGGPFPGPLPTDGALARARPPVFWGHGGSDPTMPVETEVLVRDWMRTHTDVTEILVPELGHDVDEAMTAELARFITAQPRV